MNELKEKIIKILEKTYTGSNHIGDVYNNEASDELLDLIKQQNKELIGEDKPVVKIDGKVKSSNSHRRKNARNQLRAELRIRAGLQERKNNDNT